MSRSLVTGQHPKPKTKEAEKRMHKGRPHAVELTPDVIKKMRNAILMGAPVITAAALNDIPYYTLRRWVTRGREEPESEYGEFLAVISKAIAEWEVRDLSAWDQHVVGRPAQYLMQPVINKDGDPVIGSDGKPIMEYVRDGEGNLIMQSAEIKSDWRAAAERMARRRPKVWGQKLGIDLDAVLTFDNNDREEKPVEALSFEERIAQAVKELEDEI